MRILAPKSVSLQATMRAVMLRGGKLRPEERSKGREGKKERNERNGKRHAEKEKKHGKGKHKMERKNIIYITYI